MRDQASWDIDQTAFERHFTSNRCADFSRLHERTIREHFLDAASVPNYRKEAEQQSLCGSVVSKILVSRHWRMRLTPKDV